ncbi:MAG: hypothetical protein Q7T82_03760 [Armatimonadota bacterium]|nr:hypothetical protein [Armatimonadota bacterium]
MKPRGKQGVVGVTVFLIVCTSLLLLSGAGWSQIADPSTMNGKIICGYQGWFACPGDGNDPSVGWNHWSRQSDDIGPGLYWTDMWPDVSEYAPEDLFFVPNTTLTYGGTPYLFSNYKQGAVNVHFRWMQENDVDGVMAGRFSGGITLLPDEEFRERNKVLENIQNASGDYGRVWCIGYDVTGDMDTATIYDRLVGDWESLKSAFGIYDDPRYLRHNGKPVVEIFGMGIDGDPYPVTPELATQIINYFKNDGCWIIGGVPWGWRTLTGGSKTDPAWSTVYRSFNGLMPWTVGAYASWPDIETYMNFIWGPDIAECNSLGISYHPTAWPRFKWDNMHNYPCGPGISPRGGQHFWDQVFAMKSAGAQTIFGAMFDEYDESTAMMKMTDNIPTTDCFWTNEGKPADWHLRLLNQGAKMLRGEIPLSQTIPVSPTASPDNAQIVTDNIPSTMHLGRTYNIIISVQNNGETCWNAEMFKLGAVGGSDPFTASTKIPMDPGTTVALNQQYTFRIPMTPTATGAYITDWQMSHEIVRWFGPVVSRSVDVTSSADTTAPGAVTNFAATPGDLRTILAWQTPTTADYSGVMIRYKTTGYPTSVTDGALVVDEADLPGMSDSHIHTGLTNGVTYYYSAFAHDSVPNYAGSAQSSAVPANIESPGLVSQFTVVPGDNQNALSWTNPTAADFVGTIIRYSANGYPTSQTDGLLLCDRTGSPGSADNYNHTGLVNGVTYYYSAFTYDSIPNYSAGATASGMPLGPRTPVNTSSFDSDANGWTITVWKSGPYSDGVMAWDSGAGSAGGGIRCTGSGASDNADRCTREGGQIEKIVSTAGYSNIQVQYDLRVSSLGLAMTGGGYGSCPVDHNIVDEQLTVYYSTNGGVIWKQAEYLTRASLLNYQTYGTRTIDLSHLPVCDNNPNFVLWLRWQLNSAADVCDMDNIVVTGNQIDPPDTTAPGAVTNFVASAGDRQVSLSWHNPSDSDFVGTMVRFKTTGYPASATDGAPVCDKPNIPGSDDSYPHSGLINGVTYYYAAFAHDSISNFAPGVQRDATPTGTGTLSSSTFDADLDGWTVTLWKWGADYGTMAWTSGAGNPGGAVRVSGAGASDNTDRCTREGGDLTKIISTVGRQDIQVAYDLRVNSLGADMTGGGGGSCAVDHGLIDEQLTVSYSTNGGSSWTEAEYLLRAALLASYQTYGRRTIDLSSVTACDNNPNFMLKFRWQVNSGADLCDLDNITVSTAPDTTPPGNVTGFTATPGGLQNSLSWTNPTAPDFAGVKIMFKTTGYPTGPTDGTQCYSGTGTSTIHSGLSAGVTYYYAAYAFDEVPNYASGAQASGVPTPFTISNSTFNSNADGWTITTWRAGTAYGYGTMAWLSSGAGNPGGGMRCSGNGTTDSTDRCTREGGIITKTISTVGLSNIKVSYGLDVNALGTNRTGAGTGTCTVDHALIDEQLTVYYTTNGSTWTEAHYVTRATLLASYQAWGTRTIDLTGVPACNNNPSFGLQFRWQVNTTGDQANLDNIVVTAN